VTQQSDLPDRDAFLRLGRLVRDAYFSARAFFDALTDSAAWGRFFRRVVKRAFLMLFVGIAAAVATWNYSPEIFRWLLIPAEENLTPFEDGKPIFTAPQEMFAVTVNLALKGAALAVFPVFVISLYTLFSQWLPSSYRTFIKLFIPTVFMAFVAGIAFVYYVILPQSLTFLLGFGEGVAIPFISVTNYFELVLSLMFWMGILFELPLLLYLLARLDMATYKQMKWARLGVFMFAPFFAAIITPSFDFYTWMLVSVPLIFLYEFGLFLAWAARPEDSDYLGIRRGYAAFTWPYRKASRIVTKIRGAY